MTYPCETRWFGVMERCWRPTTSWGLGLMTVAYAARAVIGLPFDPLHFGAIAAAAGFTVYQRGKEKMAQ